MIGRKTYDLMVEDNSISEYLDLPIIVLSKNTDKKSSGNTHFVSSPQAVIDLLKQKGYSVILVGGGSQTNSAFVKERLIDEIILDVEPIIFGQGIPLFAPEDFETNLELLGTKKINDNTLQLHYKVKK